MNKIGSFTPLQWVERQSEWVKSTKLKKVDQLSRYGFLITDSENSIRLLNPALVRGTKICNTVTVQMTMPLFWHSNSSSHSYIYSWKPVLKRMHVWKNNTSPQLLCTRSKWKKMDNIQLIEKSKKPSIFFFFFSFERTATDFQSVLDFGP